MTFLTGDKEQMLQTDETTGTNKYNKQKQGKLLEGFNYQGNPKTRDRQRLLYVYKNTCYDCKQLKEPKQLQMHLDFDNLPITALMLCTACHAKRHGYEIGHKRVKTTLQQKDRVGGKLMTKTKTAQEMREYWKNKQREHRARQRGEGSEETSNGSSQRTRTEYEDPGDAYAKFMIG